MKTLTVFTPAYNRAHTIGHIKVCASRLVMILSGL